MSLLCPFQFPDLKSLKSAALCPWLTPLLPHLQYTPSTALCFSFHFNLHPLLSRSLTAKAGQFYVCHREAAVSTHVMIWFTSHLPFSPPLSFSPPCPLVVGLVLEGCAFRVFPDLSFIFIILSFHQCFTRL